MDVNFKALALAAAISHVEGFWNPATVSFKNSNPGNIRAWGTLSGVSGYVKFPTKVAGWQALYEDVTANSGKLTVVQFLNKFAPAADHNQPSAYLAAVCEFTDLKPDDLF